MHISLTNFTLALTHLINTLRYLKLRLEKEKENAAQKLTSTEMILIFLDQ